MVVGTELYEQTEQMKERSVNVKNWVGRNTGSTLSGLGWSRAQPLIEQALPIELAGSGFITRPKLVIAKGSTEDAMGSYGKSSKINDKLIFSSKVVWEFIPKRFHKDVRLPEGSE